MRGARAAMAAMALVGAAAPGDAGGPVEVARVAMAFGAPAPVHRTAAGHLLVLPAPDRLSCHEIDAVITRLDLSEYRGRGLLSEGHPDYPVFLYEDRLAMLRYTGCTLPAMRRLDAGAVFAAGFRPAGPEIR